MTDSGMFNRMNQGRWDTLESRLLGLQYPRLIPDSWHLDSIMRIHSNRDESNSNDGCSDWACHNHRIDSRLNHLWRWSRFDKGDIRLTESQRDVRPWAIYRIGRRNRRFENEKRKMSNRWMVCHSIRTPEVEIQVDSMKTQGLDRFEHTV